MTPQYFDNVERLKSSPQLIYYRINDVVFSLYVDNGVFSKNGLDYGTRVLLNVLTKLDLKGEVWDIGCGWGALGLSLAYFFKDANFTLTDVNLKALELSAKNAAKLRLSNVEIYESDCGEKVKKDFDYVVANPPIRAGKKVVYRFFDDAFARLKKTGKLFVVMREKQGAKSAAKRLISVFGNCEIIEKDKGYYVLLSAKN